VCVFILSADNGSRANANKKTNASGGGRVVLVDEHKCGFGAPHHDQ